MQMSELCTSICSLIEYFLHASPLAEIFGGMNGVTVMNIVCPFRVISLSFCSVRLHEFKFHLSSKYVTQDDPQLDTTKLIVKLEEKKKKTSK